MTNTEVIADVVVAAVRAATAPLVAQCAALEVQVKALEARAPVPGPAGEKGDRGEKGEPGADGVAGARGEDGAKGADGKDAPAIDLDDVARRAALLVPAGKDGRDGADGRDGQPGVPGRDGAPGERGERGEKGIDGKDGRDGTLEGARFEQADERTWRVVRADGSVMGEFVGAFPLYRGVYTAGSAAPYLKGDAVTYGGSLWIAREETRQKPGDGVTAWQLAVKAGRDGREGKPGERGGIGPKGDRGEPGRNFS